MLVGGATPADRRLPLRHDAAFRRIGWPLGALAGGVVAEAYGPRAALLGSVAAVLAGTIIAWVSPLRAAARDHQPGAPAA
jgi:predicted MFS family arabinose efflux permease